MVKINNPKDFWSGLLFIFCGLLFMLVALNYKVGTAARMGPGYFPAMLGMLLVLIGGIIFFRSLVTKGEQISQISLRPLIFITLSLLFFAYFLRPLGFILALGMMIIISAFAGLKFHFREVLLLCLLLIILSVLVFAKGLGLPFPLWPKFMN